MCLLHTCSMSLVKLVEFGRSYLQIKKNQEAVVGVFGSKNLALRHKQWAEHPTQHLTRISVARLGQRGRHGQPTLQSPGTGGGDGGTTTPYKQAPQTAPGHAVAYTIGSTAFENFFVAGAAGDRYGYGIGRLDRRSSGGSGSSSSSRMPLFRAGSSGSSTRGFFRALHEQRRSIEGFYVWASSRGVCRRRNIRDSLWRVATSTSRRRRGRQQ